MMWHTSFWPVLVVIPVVIALVVSVARRFAPGRSGPMGMGCGFGSSRPEGDERTERPVREDPLAIVRERYARGEIDHAELEQRIEDLLRSEPTGLARSWER